MRRKHRSERNAYWDWEYGNSYTIQFYIYCVINIGDIIRYTPEKAEGTWDDNGRDGLTNSIDLRVTNGPEVRKTECCGKNLKKKL